MLFKWLHEILHGKKEDDNVEEGFGQGSSINLSEYGFDFRNYHDLASIKEKAYIVHNLLYQCKKCDLMFRSGYFALTFKRTHVDQCPYCNAKDHNVKWITDMDLINSNIPTAPKYSYKEAAKIKQLIIDYKLAKVTDQQLASYVNYHQQNLNKVYDDAIERLERTKQYL